MTSDCIFSSVFSSMFGMLHVGHEIWSCSNHFGPFQHKLFPFRSLLDILNSLGLLDFLSYRYSETQHSSRTWFWLIYFEQRLIAVSWSWSNLIQIANQSIRLSWYSPILVILIQTWGFWYQLSMPAIRVVVFNIFCLGAILDFKNIRLTSVLVVAY